MLLHRLLASSVWPSLQPSGASLALAVSTSLAAIVALAGGCTSFAFRSGGRGQAPSDLQDRKDMVALDAGVLQMGWKVGEPDEFPQHKVTLAPFLIDRTEVTLGNYRRCVEARTCKAPQVPGDGWETTEQHPVVGVTWLDAKRYCEWVNRRLPTEAEWEMAARRGHDGAYPWGGKAGPGTANLRGGEDGFERTAPVGSFPRGATKAGVVDLAGNAAEWVFDWYDATWYGKSPEGDPTGPEAPTGQRVVRGGSWADPNHLARGSARGALDPNVSNNAVGFRCAATP
ncbi:MAG: formylglycine-generating enzyme family protein [Deltaproteobacteria bacterium]|nr:formylglycine-generating enzyme family protein [Deltaproteobacteria bacterium]